MAENSKFGNPEVEAFMELGNVGAGHAAIALTNLLSREVDMSVPFVRIESLEETAESLRLDDVEPAAIVSLEINSEIKYKLSVLFKKASVLNTINLLTESKKVTLDSISDLTEMQISLIQEIGSTIVLRYITALNKMLKIDTVPETSPNFNFGKSKEMLSKVTYGDGSALILIHLDLFTENQKFDSHLFIQPHLDSIEKYKELLMIS